ncbi:MAG: hypothetical protein J6S14_09970 [Clostridia bacterium]|nr:hypothetical protein [Clostridia bacterium]
MKKIISYLLSACMILSLMCSTVLGTSAADTEFDKWDGTTTDTAWFSADKDYFELDTAAKLAGLAYLANEYQGDDHKDPGAFFGKTFVITKNIDLGGHQWTPIGISNNYAFAGLLEGKLGGIDGQAVTIANMKIGSEDAPHPTKNIGLVGSQGAGGVKNIYLTGAYINTAADTAGSFVGYSRPQKTGTPCEYSNLRSDATIITAGAKWCGGIVAYSNIAGNLFKDCVYTGNITTKNSGLTMVGGITGNANTSTDFVNCYVGGDIIADCKQVGGIIGTVTAKTTINLTNCHFDGTVSATATQAGAFIGRANSGDTAPTVLNFTDCFNSGISKSSYTPASAAMSWIGLGAGYASAEPHNTLEATFTNCYSLSDTSLMARLDFSADKINTLYKVTAGTEYVEKQADAFDMIASLRPTVVSFEEITGVMATIKMSGFDFSALGWVTRDGMYPTLAVAEKVADTKYAKADMSWFNPTSTSFDIQTESQLIGLAKIAKVYDFVEQTITVGDSVKGLIDTWFTGTFAEMLKGIVPETTVPETTAAPETTKAPETTVAPETTAAPEPTDAPVVTEAPETTPAPEKSGCGASAAFGTLAIVALLGTAIVFKKR